MSVLGLHEFFNIARDADVPRVHMDRGLIPSTPQPHSHSPKRQQKRIQQMMFRNTSKSLNTHTHPNVINSYWQFTWHHSFFHVFLPTPSSFFGLLKSGPITLQTSLHYGPIWLCSWLARFGWNIIVQEPLWSTHLIGLLRQTGYLLVMSIPSHTERPQRSPIKGIIW